MPECRQREATLVLRWEISPGAIRLSPLPEIAAMNGQAERITRAVLEWRIEDESATARLRLEIGEDDLVIDLGERVCGRWVVDGTIEHAEFGACLRVSVRGGEVVYARTSVLADVLGLPGGVYDGPLM